VLKNYIDTAKYIHELILSSSSYYIDILENNARNIFYILNTYLDLDTMKYLYNEFMQDENIEKNNHEFIKNVFKDFNNINYVNYTYANIDNTDNTDNTNTTDTTDTTNSNLLLKLSWLVSLSNKYEMTVNENGYARLTIISNVLSAIRNNDILEACKLLNLNKIIINSSETLSLECNICLETKKHCIITPCNSNNSYNSYHNFCLPCLYEWLITNTHVNCPYCRSNISLETCKYYILD
jgi:hypothetical protein